MTHPTHLTPTRLSTRPDSELLAPETSMRAVTLRVADLDAATAYYRDGVMLTVMAERAGGRRRPAQVVLGRLGTPVVILEHAPHLRYAGAHEAGLYHVAVLFDREEDLAAAVYSVATRYPGSFTGSADHLVSEAFYFTDPEGNGVELYWDRARTDWSWVDGRPQMGQAALDPNRFLREHLDEATLRGAATAPASVGHVHLSVGDIEQARDFYVDRLGFETVIEVPGSALFVSAGGYHHHMAMNVWRSRGAGRRQQTLGLGLVRIAVPSADALGQLHERLRHHAVTVTRDDAVLQFDDPWGNVVEVRTADESTSPVDA